MGLGTSVARTHVIEMVVRTKKKIMHENGYIGLGIQEGLNKIFGSFY